MPTAECMTVKLTSIRWMQNMAGCCADTVECQLAKCWTGPAGLPYSTIAPLQHVLNATVRLKCMAYVHMTMFQPQHCLPVEARKQFKLCLPHGQCCDIYNRPTAACLHTHLLVYVAAFSHKIRLASTVACMHLKYRECTFSVATPNTWNNLPLHIHTALLLRTPTLSSGNWKQFYSVNFYSASA